MKRASPCFVEFWSWRRSRRSCSRPPGRCSARAARTPIAWQGYAEADFVKVGPTQPGLLTAVHVARGDRVVKGQPLFEQDAADDRAAVDQARRLLQQARDQLANLLSPAKPSEIEQAKANLQRRARRRATGRRRICGGARRC